ncbi:Carboxylesterase patB [Colletotrichum sp. SAR 10_66]|nr:Carboxylesterase patB [Colletotrichum sp. SAR 10_66]
MTYRNFDEGFLFTNFSLASESEVMSDLTSLWHDSDGFFAETVSMLYPTSLYNRTHLDALTIYPEVREAGILESPLSESFVKRSAIIGDALVNCPTRHIARSVVKHGQPAYKLVFDAGYQFHGTTDYYLYSSVTNADGSNGGDFSFPGNATLAKIMRGYYISFALNHDPNGDGDKKEKPTWPKYQEENSEVLWVGYTDIEGRADPDNSANCQFLLNTRGTNCGLVEDW